MEGYVMRIALASAAVVALLATSGAALAQDNSCTTLVLHAVSGTVPVCTTNVDCSVVQPTVDVPTPSGAYTVVVFAKNYAELLGVQCAFDWPVTWTFGFGLWNCQTGQLSATQPTAPGPTTGTITTAFTAITGGALAPIGIMVFNSIGTGCLTIIESSFPFGTHVINAAQDAEPIGEQNRGKICADTPGGYSACTCVANAVEGATWGQIKASYR
jgi:hypothetical protein